MKIKRTDNGGIVFFCAGCNRRHVIYVEGNHEHIWKFNYNFIKPSFEPSVLVRNGHYDENFKGPDCWCTYNQKQIEKGEKPSSFVCTICHSWITDGRITYFTDSTHHLAGQTVDLPELPVSTQDS